MKTARHFLPVLLLLAIVSSACPKAPPTLGPTAALDFQKTRVIKALDVFRDFAVDGEAANPQVVPTALAKKIVTYHQATLKILDAAGTGWQTLVGTSLDQLLATLSASDQARISPYVNLIKALLAEVH